MNYSPLLLFGCHNAYELKLLGRYSYQKDMTLLNNGLILVEQKIYTQAQNQMKSLKKKT